MKFLPIREIENVTSALNFDTNDIHVEGGCDLYITKAATRKEKLYKEIDQSLEAHHESNVKFSKSLSPPDAELFNIDLTRASPFGPLSQPSSRRTFAYLVATLNASHPDYDFSQILKPSDFIRETSLRGVMNSVDQTLYALRPSGRAGARIIGPSNATLPQTPGGSQNWNPNMWRAIDKEMSLRDCDIYNYAPEHDPFEGEESAIWSHHYFFFNKDRKRVCYFYIRGISLISHSPSRTPKRSRPMSSQSLSAGYDGASKRAKYWLGDRASAVEGGWDEDDDDEGALQAPGDDEVDEDDYEGPIVAFSSSEDDDDELEKRYREKSSVRRMSEHVVESMEV